MDPKLIPSSQTVLAALAMLIIGGLAACLVFKGVPAGNDQMVTFALGALAGALTTGGVHRFTTNNPPTPPAIPPPQDPQQ